MLPLGSTVSQAKKPLCFPEVPFQGRRCAYACLDPASLTASVYMTRQHLNTFQRSSFPSPSQPAKYDNHPVDLTQPSARIGHKSL